jgi:hypothetical protein
MVSIKGYYDGTSYVAVENIDVKPNQQVIITLLDEPVVNRPKITREQLLSFAGKGGLCVPNGIDPQEYIHTMREDRVL